ncbi:hypothetical protein FUAX_49580 (plasmid) [Fulvitalea axinellae]|uniref:Lipid/polyisoprenoid-binding YceI-like domain-containing protein n=1 Tax=Fulvitalea axinellae TaxID=1182444 RepID=A0AAU9CU21_9BACT|nr:hypothetical protein FUAX_49580 [Fulvitalea axinellae]
MRNPKSTTVLTAIFVLLLTLPTVAQTIDSKKSRIEFSVSNMGFRTVEGTMRGMRGTVRFDPDNIQNASFNVCVDPATVDTDNNTRDKHLRGKKFFEVEKHPTICFTSEKIKRTDNGLVASGKLTMHGITKAVKIPFQHKGKTLTGTIKILRSDYKLGPSGGMMVGKTVTVKIICVGN